MRILSLDSSSPVASVAFVAFGEVEPVVQFRCGTPHARSDSSALFRALQEAILSCGRPDALCVGLGPGSYNGLRAGIAAARGFASALGIPLHALPSPLGLPGPAEGFWAAGDARGGHYWLARVKDGTFLEEPTLFSPAEAVAHLRTYPGLPVLAAAPLEGIAPIVTATPCAARLAMLAETHDGSTVASGTPEPLYLKPPHITKTRQPSTSTAP